MIWKDKCITCCDKSFIVKIYSYVKDPNKAKYQYLINRRNNPGFKHFNDFKAYIEYSRDMDDIYQCIEEYNQNIKQKILILFNKKRNQLVTKLLNKAKTFLLFLSNNILLCQKLLDLILVIISL